jgi:hypothetical protein
LALFHHGKLQLIGSIFFSTLKKTSPVSRQGLPVSPGKLEQGVVDGTESVTDLGSEQAHDRDHDDGDESENDGVLNQTLTFFFRCE